MASVPRLGFAALYGGLSGGKMGSFTQAEVELEHYDVRVANP